MEEVDVVGGTGDSGDVLGEHRHFRHIYFCVLLTFGRNTVEASALEFYLICGRVPVGDGWRSIEDTGIGDATVDLPHVAVIFVHNGW